jgi:hypothetical protein
VDRSQQSRKLRQLETGKIDSGDTKDTNLPIILMSACFEMLERILRLVDESHFSTGRVIHRELFLRPQA